jgi:8-oxo-dGTP diphosphatase
MLGILTKLPPGALGVLREIVRHLVRRPVVGIAAIARAADGRLLLIRRGDTGTWALPGGTLEWGEELRPALVRELEEEAGVVGARLGRVVGVFSRPDRDVRFHAVTVVVTAHVDEPVKPPKNALEITEVRLFHEADVPAELAMGMTDMLRAERAAEPVLE